MSSPTGGLAPGWVTGSGWWKCPNQPPCPHAGVFHDIYDFDDDRPTCCEEGCTCGQPA
jgi:hypothetical protein